MTIVTICRIKVCGSGVTIVTICRIRLPPWPSGKGGDTDFAGITFAGLAFGGQLFPQT